MQLNDWEKKKKALCLLYEVDAISAVVFEVFKSSKYYLKDEEIYEESVYRFQNTLSKWSDSQPIKTSLAREFFELIRQDYDIQLRYTPAWIARASYEDFLKVLPTSQRAKAQDEFFFSEESNTNVHHIPVKTYPPLHTVDQTFRTIEILHPELGRHLSINDSVDKKLLDQRLFYQSSDCASHWEGIINDRLYPTFDKCKISLDKVWSSPAFSDASAAEPISSVVMLGGGGAFSKDVALISALTSTGKYSPTTPLQYSLLDISTWMLRRSMFRLARYWPRSGWGQSVTFRALAGDFMELDPVHCRKQLRNRDGRILWALTAGTLGNISEKQFLKSLNNVALPADILVLSASVTNDNVVADVWSEEEDRYLSDEVKDLLRHAVQDLIGSLGLRVSANDILQQMIPRFTPGAKDGITDVPESLSLVMEAEIDKSAYVIFSHTHYNPTSLVKFADQGGWENLGIFYPDYCEPDFAQFLFRKR